MELPINQPMVPADGFSRKEKRNESLVTAMSA
jgi:hypothetical protein